MRTRLLLLILLTLGFVSCTIPDENDEASQVSDPSGDEKRSYFELVRIGDRTPDEVLSGSSCTFDPLRSEYTFSRTRWGSRDSIPISAACSSHVGNADWNSLRVNEGYFRLSGDTIHFYVDDRKVGVDGYVNWGWLNGDTLTIPAGEFDTGDYVYVARKEVADG